MSVGRNAGTALTTWFWNANGAKFILY
jgi:hypothetical protein